MISFLVNNQNISGNDQEHLNPPAQSAPDKADGSSFDSSDTESRPGSKKSKSTSKNNKMGEGLLAQDNTVEMDGFQGVASAGVDA